MVRQAERKDNNKYINVFDTNGKSIKRLKMNEKIYVSEANPKLLAQYIRVYLTNIHQGTASTKKRSEIAGSRRKIYRQKGTGRARHGDRYAPIFVGGGVAHGPKPYRLRLRIPKKMRRKALLSAIKARLIDKAIYIVKDIEKIEPKTKKIVKILETILKTKLDKSNERILFVISTDCQTILKSGRNVSNINFMNYRNLNAYEVLKNQKLFFSLESFNQWQDFVSGSLKA